MINGVTSVAGLNSTMSQMGQILFKKLDANGDGVIDKKEIMAALSGGKKHSAVSAKGSPTLDRAFAKLDTNNDGVISQGEFSAALSANGAGSLFSGATSSLVNSPAPASNNKSGGGPISVQNRATNNILQNYLAQCSQVAKQQAAQGFTMTV